jgi:hypothetical protein
MILNMLCPFCKSELICTTTFLPGEEFYYCNNGDCSIDDMARYQITYQSSDPNPISCAFALDDYYVNVNYRNNTTTLSKLYVVILLDSITVEKAIHFDMTDLPGVLEKVKTLLLFS